MIRPRSFRRTGSLAAACLVAFGSAACGGGGGGSPPPTLDAVEVAPAVPAIAKGRTQAFTATARYSDASAQDVTALATWTSSGAAATMAGAVATGAQEGSVTVTAAYGGRTGQATLTVTAAELDAIAVEPATVELAEGLTAPLAATGTWSDGSTTDVTATAAWSSDDPLAASVSAGVVTAVGQGEAVVTASQGGRSGQAAVTVTAAALQSIVLSPASLSLAKGRSDALTATARWTNGGEQDVTALALWSAEPAGVASVAAGVVEALDVGTTTVSAAWEGEVGTATIEVTAPALETIEVTPATASVAKGLTQGYAATGHYSDGSTENLTALATWTSSRTDLATMSGAIATGVAEGEATVTAEYGGRSGGSTLTVTAPVILSVTVSPSSASIAKGLTQAFTAAAHWSDTTASDVTATATWTTGDPAVATASGSVVTGASTGSTTVEATAAGVTGSAGLTVTPAEVASLTLSPVNATVAAGLTLQYGAVAVYTDGSKQDVTADAVWAAAPDTVATLAAGGLATGVAAGDAMVTASYSGATAETALTVTDATLVTLSISPRAPTVPLGVAQAFTAVGIFSDGTRQELTTQVAWTATPAAVATISSDGVATPLAEGTADVSAVLGAISDTTPLVVTAATLDALVVDPPSASIAVGTSAPFTATGLYSDGSSEDLTALATWSSSDAAVATVSSDAGSAGVATGVATGIATVTATFGGLSDAAGLEVTGATLVSLAVAPPVASAPAGTTARLTAIGTFSDGSTQDLTTAAGWTSSDPSIAAVSNALGEEGLVTAVAPGAVTITAEYDAVSATAAFTVTDVTLVSVAVTPDDATLPVGYTRPYRATAAYSDSSERDVTAEVTWQASAAFATISNAIGSQGVATGVAAGDVVLSATLAGVTGTASLAVTNETLDAIAVTPVDAVVAVRGKVQMTATGTFSLGTVLDITSSCSWSTSRRTIARVTQGGLVTGIAPGSVTVTAKKKITGSTTVFVQ